MDKTQFEIGRRKAIEAMVQADSYMPRERNFMRYRNVWYSVGSMALISDLYSLDTNQRVRMLGSADAVIEFAQRATIIEQEIEHERGGLIYDIPHEVIQQITSEMRGDGSG